MSQYGDRAERCFRDGYNCAQAVLLAFADDCGLPKETAVRLASSFGGGIGGMRSVCGAVSGMCMAAGLLRGYRDPGDHAAKKEHYAFVASLLKEFEAKNGSVVCRELLGLAPKNTPDTPSERSAEYYKKRPCAELVRMAAEILERSLKG